MRTRLLYCFLILAYANLLSAVNICAADTDKPYSFKIYKNPRDEILKILRERTEGISLGREKTGLTELDAIKDTMSIFGLRNLPEISVTILREIDTRKGDLTSQERLSLAEKAVSLSPDIPAVLLKVAPFYLNPKSFKPVKSFGLFASAIRLQVADLSQRIIWLSNIIFWSVLGLTLTVVVFMICACIKYSKLLHHLLVHILPKAFSGFSIGLLMIFLPLLSFFTLGPLSLILVFLFYFWIFFSWQEKLVGAIILIAVMVLPFALYTSVYPTKYLASSEAKILKFDLQLDFESVSRNLGEILASDPEKVEAKFALALIAKRAENYSAAGKLLAEVISQKPGWDKPLVNLGNVNYIRGNLDAAVANYNKAVSLNGQSFLAKYNLGKAYFKLTRIDEANAQLKAATALDPAQFDRLESISDAKTPSRTVFDESISMSDLAPRVKALYKFDASHLNRVWGNLKLMDATPIGTSIMCAAVLLLLIVMAKSENFISAPRSCTICGTSYCKRCSKIKDRRNVCSQCYYVFVSRDSIDPNFRIIKESQERRHKRISNLVRKLGSLLMPGFGNIYMNRAVSGCITTFIFSTILVRVLIPHGILTDPYSIALESSVLSTSILLLLALAVYVFSNLSLRRSN